jgi:hypothetical protein
VQGGEGHRRPVARERVDEPLRVRWKIATRGRFDVGAGIIATGRPRHTREPDCRIVVLLQRQQDRPDRPSRQFRDDRNRRQPYGLGLVRCHGKRRQTIENVAAPFAIEQAAGDGNGSHAYIGFAGREKAEDGVHESRILTSFEDAEQGDTLRPAARCEQCRDDLAYRTRACHSEARDGRFPPNVVAGRIGEVGQQLPDVTS